MPQLQVSHGADQDMVTIDRHARRGGFCSFRCVNLSPWIYRAWIYRAWIYRAWIYRASIYSAW